MSIPQEIIDSVREATNITDLIGEQVELKRRGSNQLGLCPFHSENSPSFSVNEEKGYYYCFGCGAKGNVFDFVRETRGFSFPEAVRLLASRAGIIVPEFRRGDQEKNDQQKKHRQRLRDIITAAQDVYMQCGGSSDSTRAQQYLKSRGLTSEIIDQYKIGFVPESWDFILPEVFKRLSRFQADLSEGECKKHLVELGLLKLKQEDQLKKSSDRDYYDIFRNRIIFPIHRSDGMPIAFGGRTLSQDKKTPKYLNSPETVFYQKKKTLYGIYQAASAMRQTREAFLVEGYFDVVSMAQAGFATTLATCGTAVSAEHAQLLKRFVQRLVLLFDGDDAGRKAAASCFSVFHNSGLEVKAVLLPQGEDPDSLTKGSDKTKVEKLLKESARPIVEIYLENLREGFGSSAAGVGKTAAAFALEVSKVSNRVEQEALMHRGADLLGVSLGSLSSLLKESQPVGKVVDVPRELDAYPEADFSDMEGSIPFDLPPPMPEEFFERSQGSISVNESRISKPKSTIDQFCDHLVVAVMIEPKVATSLLGLSLSHQVGLVVDVLPKNIGAFVRDVAAKDCDSLIPLDDEGNGEVSPEAAAVFAELLSVHGLENKDYVNEAIQQSQVGGFHPAGLVEDAVRFAVHQSIDSEVQVLRKLETNEKDLSTKLKLAQDKLMKKRSLTQFGREQD